MNISIRNGEVTDAEDVARLARQLGYEVAAGDVAARLARLLPRPDQQLFIAEANSHTLGWLHAARAEFVEAEAFVTIAGLVVDSSHRRQGIGTLLVRRAEQWAAAQECSLVRLWSSTRRTSAHRFYERLGYTIIKTQYSFAKSIAGEPMTLGALVPRVDQ
jgi:GNAT superfamily N-acetyltransferase